MYGWTCLVLEMMLLAIKSFYKICNFTGGTLLIACNFIIPTFILHTPNKVVLIKATICKSSFYSKKPY
uniref:Uncharacterized protein n=1 Tax=Rhizophora mucronata TaxID=61149 RepID=A0A2P2QFG9_RHIMU